jgi:hypothetical protein
LHYLWLFAYHVARTGAEVAACTRLKVGVHSITEGLETDSHQIVSLSFIGEDDCKLSSSFARASERWYGGTSLPWGVETST